MCGDEKKTNTCIRNLEVWIDPELKMCHHVKHIQQVSYRNIRELRLIRQYLTSDAIKTLVQAMVISHLDYSNSLLYGISANLLDTLQRVQNAAARLVLGIPKFDHITEGLKRLHWLPVRYRITYKIAVITYKVLANDEPRYLRDLLIVQKPKRTLRSSSSFTLQVPRTKLKCAGDRSFAACAPKIWNSLPDHLTSAKTLTLFKKQLKTHLFKKAYT